MKALQRSMAAYRTNKRSIIFKYLVAASLLLALSYITYFTITNKPSIEQVKSKSSKNKLKKVDCNSIHQLSKDGQLCKKYSESEFIDYPCIGNESKVPLIYHVVSSTMTLPHLVRMNSLSNNDYRLNYHTDESARDYIKDNCGSTVLRAYDCINIYAYRADLFRFCALHSEGGVYMDADILSLVPFREMYSECAVATVGHDFPSNGKPVKQMKILASQKGAPIFKCAMDTIVNNVRNRNITNEILGFSGPVMLQSCYEKHSDKVAISYLDSREAKWPYTGMRRGYTVIAYELPGRRQFPNYVPNEIEKADYAILHRTNGTISSRCQL